MTHQTPSDLPEVEIQIEQKESIFTEEEQSTDKNNSFLEEEVSEEEEKILKKVLTKPYSVEETRSIASVTDATLSETEERGIANSLDIKREDTRSLLAKWLICIFGFTYLFTIGVMLSVMFMPVNDKEQRTERYNYSKDVFSLLMSTQTGIIGAVLGFYFGSNRNKNS